MAISLTTHRGVPREDGSDYGDIQVDDSAANVTIEVPQQFPKLDEKTMELAKGGLFAIMAFSSATPFLLRLAAAYFAYGSLLPMFKPETPAVSWYRR